LSLIVYKFGGSCLKSIQDLERISEIIGNSHGKPVVVVSAFGGVTNLLLEAINCKQNPSSIISKIRAIHADISSTTANIVNSERFSNLLVQLAEDAAQLEENRIDDSIEHRILSYGEKMASVLIAEYLKMQFHQAVAVWAEEIGVVIQGGGRHRHLKIEPALPVLNEMLSMKNIPIITGWYGINEDGKIAVLERGGSDVTASAIGAVLQARKVVLWKDIDGILSINPLHGIKGKKIPYLGYSEASELARLGTSILHSQCIEPVANVGVALELRPLHGEGNGTVIGPDLNLEQPQVKAIVCTHPVRMVTITTPSAQSASSLTREILQIFEQHDIKTWFLQTISGRIEMVVDDAYPQSALQKLMTTGLGFSIGEVSSLVSLIGNGISNISREDLMVNSPHGFIARRLQITANVSPSLHFLIDHNELIEFVTFLTGTFGLIAS